MKCPPVLHNVKFINDLIMERKLSFSQFASIAESQILDDAQMNAIEAGDSCTQSCKKSCQPGNQNSNVGNGNSVDLSKLQSGKEMQKVSETLLP